MKRSSNKKEVAALRGVASLLRKANDAEFFHGKSAATAQAKERVSMSCFMAIRAVAAALEKPDQAATHLEWATTHLQNAQKAVRPFLKPKKK